MLRTNTNRKKGFTLIELLVVILILAILAALIVPRFFGETEKAKRAKAATDIKTLGDALQRFRLDNDRYPTAEEGLEALVSRPDNVRSWNRYIEKVPVDPWGYPYVYDVDSDEEFTIVSFGKDGQEGGEGDNMDISNRDAEAQ